MKMTVRMAIVDRSNKQQPSSVRKSVEGHCVMEASGTIVTFVIAKKKGQSGEHCLVIKTMNRGANGI